MEKLFEWVIAYRNLFRNKWRTFATMLAIITGFTGICLLGGYIIRMEAYLRVNMIYINQLGHISIYAKDGVDYFYLNPEKFQLKRETLSSIYKVIQEEFKADIDFTGEYLSGQGLISNGDISRPFVAKGVDPEVQAKVFDHPLVKKWTQELSLQKAGDLLGAVKENAGSVSATKELGELIGLKTPFISQEMNKREVVLVARTIDGDLNILNALVGLQHTTGSSLAEDTSMVAPISLLKQLYALDGVTNLSIYLKEDSDSTSSIVKKLSMRFEELNLNVDVIPYYDERIGQFYSGTMSFFYIMAGFFVLLICSAVAISIVNAMTMGILERAKEIGTMRSLGMGVKLISRIFMKEAILMTLFGVAIGGALTALISFIISALHIRFFPPGVAGSIEFIVTPELWFCLLMAVIMAMISAATGFYVSKKNANSKIIELLTDTVR